MTEKKKPWDDWIKGATMALGPAGVAAARLGSMAVNKVKTDARNEARAMSYPKRETTYSRTPEESRKRNEGMMSSPNFGKVKAPAKSGSIGRESAEKARDNLRQYEERKKKSKK